MKRRKTLTLTLITVVIGVLNILVIEKLGYWVFLLSFVSAFIIAWFIEPMYDAITERLEGQK